MEKNGKKISFGFSKLTKKSNLFQPPVQEPKTEEKVQLIEYLEEKSIKVIGGEEKEPEPLVIPMRQPNKKLVNLVEIVKNNFEDVSDEVKQSEVNNVADETKLSLDELAAKELIQDLQDGKSPEDVVKVTEIPKTDKVTFEGEKESSLDDYDSVPIIEFGKAMLRGMGWKDGQGIGKNSQNVKMVQPALRPKGMGLGADKLTKQSADQKPAVDRDGKLLSCKKNAFVKIIAGYHKGSYGQIMGFDDDTGRFIIKTALGGINISLNEFLVQPVTKDEYDKNSKVINNAKYEHYIKMKQEADRKKLELIKLEKQSESSEDTSSKSKKRQEKHAERRKEAKLESDSEENEKKSKRKSSKSEKTKHSFQERSLDRKMKIKHEDKYKNIKTEDSDLEENDRKPKEKSSKSKERRHKKSYASDSEEDRKSKKKSSKDRRKHKNHDSDSDEKPSSSHRFKEEHKNRSDSDEDRKSKKKSSKDRRKHKNHDSDSDEKPSTSHRFQENQKNRTDSEEDRKSKKKSSKERRKHKNYDTDSDESPSRSHRVKDNLKNRSDSEESDPNSRNYSKDRKTDRRHDTDSEKRKHRAKKESKRYINTGDESEDEYRRSKSRKSREDKTRERSRY